MESELDHAVRRVVAGRTVRPCRAERVVGVPAHPRRELGDPEGRVVHASRRLWQEALVQVLVAANDHIRAVLVERVPERLDVGRERLSVDRAGVEARVVPVGDRADAAVGGEVRAQPVVLRLSEVAAVG